MNLLFVCSKAWTSDPSPTERKHPFGNLKRCLEDFQVHPLKWPWLGHCAGAQYARRLSCSTWRTISCHQCPWSIKIDVNMWGKELTTCFWVFQLGWWKMCLDFFFVKGRLSTSNFDSLSQMMHCEKRWPVATLNRDAFPFPLTSWNKQHGYGGMVFHHLVKLPLLVVFCQKFAPPSNASGKDLKLSTHHIHIYTPENYHSPCKMMVGRQLSVSKGPFLGDKLIFSGEVTCSYEI